jgi:hypothetical protein
VILNSSRASAFQKCKEYAFNWDELKLLPFREADPLMIGEAWHLGQEILAKSGSPEESIAGAEKRFRERLSGQMILPEEREEIEREIEFVKHGMRAWSHHYDKADFKVLMPEVPGLVVLPNTEHHCFFVHRLLYPYNAGFECNDPRCVIPHHFKFKTDAIVEFYHKIYLLESKTTSSTERNHFWEKWNMDFQTGCYLYGITKATGMRPTGFLLNAIIKHYKKPPGSNKSGYKMQLDPTNVDFERETFIFTPQAIDSWERELIIIAGEYEAAFQDPSHKIYRNTQGCFSYNRRCYYWDRCKRKMNGEQADLEGEFRTRPADYVDLSYYELIGIKPPQTKEELCQIQTTKPLETTNNSTMKNAPNADTP